MKRCIALLMIVLVLLACPAVYAQEKWTLVTPLPGTKYAVDENIIWSASDDPNKNDGTWRLLYRIDDEGKTELICELERIMALDAYDGDVYVACGKDDPSIKKINKEGVVLQEWTLPGLGDAWIYSLSVLDNYIALRVENELYVIDMLTGFVQEWHDMRNITALATCGKNQIAISKPQNDGRYGIYSIDLITEKIELLGLCIVEPEEMAVMADDRILVFTSTLSLYIIAEDSMVQLSPVDYQELANGSPSIIGRSRMRDGKVFLDVNKQLYSADIDDLIDGLDGKSVLTIYSRWPVLYDTLNLATRIFEERHPDMKVKFVSIDKEDFVQELMASTGECDIAFLQWGEQRDMLRAGLLADLRVYPQVMDSLMNWIDIGAMKAEDGAIYMLPVDVWDMDLYLVQDTERLSQSGIDTPVHSDYETFMKMGETLLARSSFFDRFYLCTQTTHFAAPILQYCAVEGDCLRGEYNFDTDEFRTMLGFWKEMMMKGYSVSKSSTHEHSHEVIFDTGEMNLDLLKKIADGDYAYLPTESGKSICTIAVDGLYMHTNGRQKEYAAEYLAIYASLEVQGAQYRPSNLFLSELTDYNECENWMSEDLITDTTSYENWVSVLENSVYRPELDELIEVMHTLGPAYIDGTVSEDEIIDALNAKVHVLT